MNRAAPPTTTPTGHAFDAARGIIGLTLALHGLLHVMGVVLLLRLAEPGELTYAMANPEPGTPMARLFAVLWAVAAIAFVGSGWQVLRGRASIAMVITASVASIVALAPMAAAAPAGIVISAGALLAVLRLARSR